MAAYEVLLLNTAIPQIQAAQSGDTYVVPRDIAFSTVASFAAGAEATPSIVATGDTNTGIWFPAADTVAISTGGISRLRLNTSGNLGLGVTPTTGGYGLGMQISDSGTSHIMSLWVQSINTNDLRNAIANNAYSSGVGTWKYQGTGAAATLYETGAGQHRWSYAATGTAGNAITFIQAMTLDASGNLVIGNTSTSYKFEVYGGVQRTYVNADSFQIVNYLTNASTGTSAEVAQRWTAGTNTGTVGIGGSGKPGATFYVGSDVAIPFALYTGNSYMTFSTNGTEKARITSGGVFQVSSGGSVQVGGTAARATTAGTNRLDIFNGTAPVGTLTNGISIYSSSGEAYVMDAAGNATLFSPHDAETNEWIFKSKHTPTGKVLKIDVERLLKFVNDHFGLDAVHEFVEE